MDEQELYRNRRKKARLAGVCYLILALAALPDMLRKSLFIAGDAVATGGNILANAALFRLSILGDIVTEVFFLFLALSLYGLLREVSRGAARAMLSLVVIAVTMTVFNTGNEIAAIGLFEADDQVHGILMIAAYQASALPVSVFFGLWMMPLGYLFLKSGFMPRLLGILVTIGGSGYVIHSIVSVIAPRATEQFVLLSVIAEVATIVWLLAFGVKRPSGKGGVRSAI
ncbi:MAG: DUF4386 domain-containing protein [Spirochaetes bacterium]|nr:DUF4386 domain-containing protein [Spirochaetota bacterium]MBU1081175.1 DUF4386 domain-containing protein [Spirochaetota bacterium]